MLRMLAGTKEARIMFNISASDLTPEILADSKVYLFLLSYASSSTASTAKEQENIVGCAIAQHIETAMKIVPESS